MNRLLPLRRVALALVLFASGGVLARAAGEPAAPANSLDELRAQFDALVTAPRFASALWSVKVVSLTTGRTWFEYHAERLMAPASNCKLYTGALALDVLGRDYRIVTPVYATVAPDGAGELRGDVIVCGRGDPSWRTRGTDGKFWDNFEPFVAALEKAHVRHITGDLVADATWLHTTPNGNGWMVEDLNDSDGAEVSAITLEDNYADLRVTPGASAGQPCEIAFVQPHTGLTLDNRTLTAAPGAARSIAVRRIFDETVLHVFGEMPPGGREEILKVPVPRPATWFAEALKEVLARRGIRVEGRAVGLRWPDHSPVGAADVLLGQVSSPPLRDLIAAFMKPSQNLETDLIFDHVGEVRRATDAPALRTAEESAVLALRDFLLQHELPLDEVRFYEGSGLSQYNLASANATVALLKFMSTHPAARDFYDALPIAGVDGTMRSRLRGTPAAGNLRGKTGTLRWANSLSGYVTTAGGEKLAYSFMLNRYVAPEGRPARAELDELALLLTKFKGHEETAPKS